MDAFHWQSPKHLDRTISHIIAFACNINIFDRYWRYWRHGHIVADICSCMHILADIGGYGCTMLHHIAFWIETDRVG